MKTRSKVTISGRVQNVGFRAFLQSLSNELGVKGWVQNTDDDKVEAVLEGDTKDIRQVLEACEVGPRAARVEKIDVVEQPYKGDFENLQVK
ncbi:MAG: acylphosphatase [Balneolales bacterium]